MLNKFVTPEVGEAVAPDLVLQPSGGPDIDEECVSCSENITDEICPNSKRPCGHHCNHSWSHDACCWCNRTFENEEDFHGDWSP